MPKKLTFPSAESDAPPSAEVNPPLVLVGLEQTPAGWMAVSVTVSGDRVTRKERHCPPQHKQFAAKVLHKLLTKHVLFPGGF